MKKNFTNIFYWIIRIALYYFIYEEIELLDTLITFIVTMILTYYSPNFMFKMMGEFMDELIEILGKGSRVIKAYFG